MSHMPVMSHLFCTARQHKSFLVDKKEGTVLKYCSTVPASMLELLEYRIEPKSDRSEKEIQKSLHK